MNVGCLQRLLYGTLVRRSPTQLKNICNFPNRRGLLSFSTLHATTILNNAGLGKGQLQLLQRQYSDERDNKTENCSSEPVKNADEPLKNSNENCSSEAVNNVDEPLNSSNENLSSEPVNNVDEPLNSSNENCSSEAVNNVDEMLSHRNENLNSEPVNNVDEPLNSSNENLSSEAVNNVDEPENTSDKLVTHDDKPLTEVNKPDILYRAIDIYVKGHELAALESYMEFCNLAANELGITVRDTLTPKFIADRSTLLKSKHIYKKHRVQYEIRTHKKVLQIKFLTGTTADVFLEYIQRNLPAGVAMHVHRFELERIPEHIREEIKKNMSKLTEEDWKFESKMMKKCRKERYRGVSKYEEHYTTKRFLLGKVS